MGYQGPTNLSAPPWSRPSQGSPGKPSGDPETNPLGKGYVREYIYIYIYGRPKQNVPLGRFECGKGRFWRGVGGGVGVYIYIYYICKTCKQLDVNFTSSVFTYCEVSSSLICLRGVSIYLLSHCLIAYVSIECVFSETCTYLWILH